MYKSFKSIIKNQKGAIENILVAILLVMIGVGAFIAYSTWMENQNTNVKNETTNVISKTLNDTNN
ncbi:hypothetical protein [Arcobacter roscoffensis]|uniref:Class III signal peptide-containing protein n=1 Tax=Arcobacter roscoffensis TaxID=2961520 RepID=A0ABY5E3R4_9BACT|nr:hypothetical protein [Arcobacter roscoffensis]UTJ06797.1 hypothetical protein NJU99_01550 [Arcobacter roscoffensis]|tara:strand:- start:217 stop:411 length:195 start_codon:yes stop_codon:yes gene_type:complete